MSQSKSQVLVPVTATGADRAETLALSLCEGYGADLCLVGPATAPGRRSLTVPGERLKRECDVSDAVRDLLPGDDPAVNVSGGLRGGPESASFIVDVASEHDVDVIVLDANRYSSETKLGRSKVRRIVRNTACDVVVVGGPRSLEDVRTILVPIADGPHSGLAVEVAAALVTAKDVWCDVLHVVPPSPSAEDRERASRLLEDALDAFDNDRADDWLLEADDVGEAIVEESKYYDLTILGTPERNRLKRFLLGSTTDSVVSESTVPVVVAWRNQS